MAKMSLRWGKQRAGPVHRVPVKVTIQRRVQGGPNMPPMFEACVMSGKRNAGSCAEAKNPKTALAEAFAMQSRRLTKRPAGAFMGLVAKRHSRRKRRR
jgi:hypothetical protein